MEEAALNCVQDSSFTPTASPLVANSSSQSSASLRRSVRPKPSPQSLRSSPPAIKFYESTRVKPAQTATNTANSVPKKASKASSLAPITNEPVNSFKLRLPQRSPSPKTKVVKLMMPTLENLPGFDSPTTRNLPQIAPKPATSQGQSTSLLGKLSLRLFGSSTSSMLSVEEATPKPSKLELKMEPKATVKPDINKAPEIPALVNDDHCAACNGTGNFICCDSCPRSFHFTCAEPPLDPMNVPEDDWFCSECRAVKESSDLVPKGADSFSTLWAQMFAGVQRDNPKCFIMPKRLRSSKEEPSSGPTNGLLNGPTSESTMTTLKPASRKSNSTTSSSSIILPTQNSNSNSNSIVTAAGIKAPLIGHLKAQRGFCHCCNEAGLTRRALESEESFSHAQRHARPLLSCAICPLYFHLDCLDPPMVNLPPLGQCERWTCPVHLTKERCLALELAEPLVAACYLLPESAIRLQFAQKRRRILKEAEEGVDDAKDDDDAEEERLYNCNQVVIPDLVRAAYHE